MQIDNTKSVISKLRKGDTSDPFISKVEQLTVSNGKVVLSEIPNNFERVIVTGENITWNEITSGTPDSDSYLVDYIYGVVLFSSEHEAKSLTFSYTGRGSSYLSSKRIYTVEENGEVTETLQTLVDSTTTARDDANEASTSLNHKGTYSSTTQYKQRNIVNYSGNSYMALVDVVGVSPLDDTKWKKLSGFAYKNQYVATTTYQNGDYISDQNEEIYMSLVDGNIGNPLTDVTKWKLLISAKQLLANVRQATTDAQLATDAAEDATIAANLATENANSKATLADQKATHAQQMGDYAKGVGDNLSHKGDYSNTTAYKKGNLVWYSGVTYICIQDTSAGVLPTQASYWRVVSNETTINSQTFTATQGQTVFTLANGSYVVGDNHLKVWVGGVPQIIGQGFTETSSTSFTLSEGVDAGMKVRAEWFEGAVTITRGHTTTHELGGQDEIDVTKLKNYNVISEQLAEKATQVDLNTTNSNVSNNTSAIVLKADKSYTDEQLALKRDKSSKITSIDLDSTLDANKIKLVNLSDEVKQSMAGTTPINASVADSSLTTEKYADDSITAKKINFIKKSSNLFNSSTITTNKTISGSTGDLVDSTGNNVSDYIPIYPNTIYTGSLIARRAFYDSSKVFISSFTTDGTFTSPVNAKYVRIVVGSINLPTAQMNLGGTLLPYEKFYEELKTDNLPNIPSDKIADGMIKLNHTDFIEFASTNLFNKGKVIEDKALSTLGELVDNTSFSTSEFIEVPPNTTFTISIPGGGRYVWYKNDKTFDATWFITEPKTFTTGSLVYYLRMSVPKANMDEAQLNEGSDLLKYEPYALSVNGVKIYGGDSGEKKLPLYVVDGELDGVFNSPTMESKADGTVDPLFNKSATQMYAHYDELMNTYPSYITKTLLGNDALGNPINRYDFKPAQPGDLDIKIPKVIISTATHGSEKAGVWTAYQTLKQICENWSTNPILDYLRWHIHFVVVPIVNPSGFNAYTRKNSNGVDINRNFPDYWVLGADPAELTYGGAAPLSELEAQYMDNLLKNEKDVIYVCDFHNFTTPPDNKYFIWNPASDEFNAKLSNNLISKMSRKWKSEQAYLPGDTFFGYSTIFKAGTLAQRAYTTYGIESSTFEICERFMLEQPAPVSFSSLTFKMGVDAFTNWLALVIKNNILMMNRNN